jgi:hypothetical protein
MRAARKTAVLGTLLLMACGAKSTPEAVSAPPQDSASSAAMAIPAPAASATAPPVDPVPSAPPKRREEGIARGPLKTSDDAIRAFRAAWSGDVTSALRARGDDVPLRRSADVLVGKVSASMQPCQTYAAELRRVWGVQRSLVIFGGLDGLERAGQCWAIVTAHAVVPVAGYMTAIDGRLMLAWQVPEN